MSEENILNRQLAAFRARSLLTIIEGRIKLSKDFNIPLPKTQLNELLDEVERLDKIATSSDNK